MLLLIFICFSILAYFTNVSLGTKNSNNKNTNHFEFNCGNDRIVREPFTYKSEAGGNKQIFISKNEIGSGGFSWVFAGYVKDRFDQLPFEKCVAIKLTKQKENNAAKNELAIKLQKRSKCFVKNVRMAISGKKRRRLSNSLCDFIAQIFDIGTVSAEKVPIKLLAKQQKQGAAAAAAAADDGILVPLGVTIMELGEDTLNDRLYDQPMDFNDQIGAKHLNERIREIVQPLRALHKVAMHLDVKPMNFLYTKNESAAGELLKLIDFDGAELLPKGTICKEPEFKLGTTVYASPEYFMRCSKMSTKSDIWSLGVIVYEMLLAQPHIGLYNKANQPAANQHNKFLRDFADLYKGFSYDKAEKEFSYSSNDLDWLDGHIELIELLVRLWNEQHPRIALLLTGLLSYQFGARPSADAVLDFIGEEDQSCYLEFVRNVNDGSLMLFNGVSAVMLGQLLEQRIEELDPSKNVWLMSLDVLPDKSDMERQYFQQILAKLNGAIEAMNAEDKRLRDGGRKCGQSME